MAVWQIWIIAALILVIIEIFTSGFAVACFSVGCIFAAIASGIGLSVTWQFLIFAFFSFLAFIFVRPFVMKYLDRKSEKKKVSTNMDALIGRIAVVTEPIEAEGYGRVKIDGDDWKARGENWEHINIGVKVEILAYDSIILTVKEKTIVYQQ